MTARRYGTWAGNPAGTPEDPQRCVKEVWENHRSYQCQRRRGHGPNGAYCRQHDPAAVAAKLSARQARYDASWAARARADRFERLRCAVADAALAAYAQAGSFDALEARVNELRAALEEGDARGET